MKDIFAGRGSNDIIEIEAFLSKKQLAMIQNEEAEVEIPYNTELINKAGSRRLSFVCYGKNAAIELADGLDASSIEWQAEYTTNDALQTSREFLALYKDESSLDKRNE